ncbi:MAG: TRAP transporter large permease [Centipeda sp. (in: firmicutes)]|uniref:TRAP transporter large permease n=1 Tax=Selenomonas sp. oral taxon 920 TaxID=1884263 RepID=UPI000840BC2D|nr:TRAP transporter large permease subunit [Selenomonas sp. oral taxon 920]AOH47013.1 C4-dicarboxylate ABC transporter permease [Selenomonas sp. oral taxon 920]
MEIAGILFAVLFLVLFLGVPIAISLGIAAVVTMLVTSNPQYLASVPTRMFTQLDSFTLMAVPFFILAGNIMAVGGISDRLIGFIELLLRRLPGRLACISVVASAFFGAISGSNPATVAAIGGITSPKMLEKGYPRDVTAAIAASSGTLGVVIPPSIGMVTYAVTAGVSVTAMFLGGWIPGIMLAVGLCVMNMFKCRKFDTPDRTPYPAKEYVVRFKDAFLALLMPVIILGGIYTGVFTPTESAAVACVYALVVSVFVFREVDAKKLYDIFAESCVSSAIVMFIISMSAPFSWFMTTENIPTILSTTIMAAFSSKYVILLMMNFLLLFLGCFLETQSIILLVTPILLPIAVALGVDPIVLGLIIIVNTSIGMITPPMAVNIFVASSITKASIGAISKRVMPYLILEFAILLFYMYVQVVFDISFAP